MNEDDRSDDEFDDDNATVNNDAGCVFIVFLLEARQNASKFTFLDTNISIIT